MNDEEIQQRINAMNAWSIWLGLFAAVLSIYAFKLEKDRQVAYGSTVQYRR